MGEETGEPNEGAAKPDASPPGGQSDGGAGKHDASAQSGNSHEGGDKGNQKDAKDAKPPEPPRSRWPWFVGLGMAAVAVTVVLALLFWPRSNVDTNDAYVTAHYAVVAPRIGGQVARVLVDDNQAVRAGQPLVELDPRDLRAALDRSLATLDADRAQVEQALSQLARQPNRIEQSAAQIDTAVARLGLSRPDAARYADLAATGAGSIQRHQQADATLRQDGASLRSARADERAAREQMVALRSDVATARAKVREDEAQVEQARLNLSYARVYAPVDGTVDQRSVEVGNYVAPGAAMMTVVPLDSIYVVASYREVALRHMRPGQHVRIHVDAYDIWLDGVVQSLPASTGAALSPIPATNATGNFTKVVQRLPVKIVLVPGQRQARLLRVGMSVETKVGTGRADVAGEQARTDGWVTAPASPQIGSNAR